MEKNDFGELNGYNTVMEYSFQMLEVIKNLNSKEVDYESMKKLADPKYEYAVAKLICMVQTINFFQLYERYGRNIDISAINVKKIMQLLEDFSIDNEPDIDIKEKEKIFRNCLAHGRYTLSMDNDGDINVVFEDPTAIVNGQTTRIKGMIPYKVFKDLSSLYISAVNNEQTNLEENPNFQSISVKNFSMDKLCRTFFNYVEKEEIAYNKNFEAHNDFDDAVNKYTENPDSAENYGKFKQETVRLLKSFRTDKEVKRTQLSEEEKDFFKKYFKFIGKKKFEKMLTAQFTRLRISRGAKFHEPKSAEDFMKKVINIRDIKEFFASISVILEARKGKLFIEGDQTVNTGLISFIETIDHMNELGSTEKASTVYTDERAEITLGRLFGIDFSKFPMPTRDTTLKHDIERQSFFSPFLYSNMVIAMTSYAIGYAKEVNSNYNREIFDFKDLDLKGLHPAYDDHNRPSIKTVDIHEKLEKELQRKIVEKRDSLTRKIRKDLNFENKKGIKSFDLLKDLISRNSIDCSDGFLNEIDEIKQEIISIYGNIENDSDEEKNKDYLLEEKNELQTKLQRYIDIIKNKKELKSNKGTEKTSEDIIKKLTGVIEKIDELKEVEVEINELRQAVVDTEGEQPYQDSSTFFDHIRNSFTHSYFKINYDELFETGDFSKIMYHLEDFDDGRKTFEIDLSSGELIYLMGKIQERLNISITQNRKTSLDNIDLNMLRDNKRNY